MRLYLIEAALLGIFMISACTFEIALEHPSSPIRQAIDDAFVRRVLMGLAMGLTAICLIYSPWGKRSGAHMNPSVTLCFLRLGRIPPRVATGYMLSQFAGGAVAVLLTSQFARMWLAHPSVNFVATTPGAFGTGAAWAGEFTIAFMMMAVVMTINKRPALAPWTGCFAGFLVALFIIFEAPISGMSLNPARTFASAFPAGTWTGLWIYFTAPPLGMLVGLELHRLLTPDHDRLCGKFSHPSRDPGIIRCNCLKNKDSSCTTTSSSSAPAPAPAAAPSPIVLPQQA